MSAAWGSCPAGMKLNGGGLRLRLMNRNAQKRARMCRRLTGGGRLWTSGREMEYG